MTFEPPVPTGQGQQSPPVAPGPDSGWAQPEPRPAATPSFIPAGISPAGPPKSSGRGSSVLTTVLVITAIVAAVGLGFAAGRATAPATAGRGNFGDGGQAFPNASGRPTGGGGIGRLGGAISVTGSVVALGNGTMTVQDASGNQVTVAVPSTATYHSQAAGSASDVAIGTNVTVTVERPQFRGPDASGAPDASPGAARGQGGLNLTATDVLVLGK